VADGRSCAQTHNCPPYTRNDSRFNITITFKDKPVNKIDKDKYIHYEIVKEEDTPLKDDMEPMRGFESP